MINVIRWLIVLVQCQLSSRLLDSAFSSFDGLGFCKFPGGGRFVSVTLISQCVDFIFQLFLSGNATVEALFGDYRQLNLSHIQPTALLRRVVKLEFRGKLVSLFRAECLVEGTPGYGYSGCLGWSELFSMRVVEFWKHFHEHRVFDTGSVLKNRANTLASKGFNCNKQIADAVSLIFVIFASHLARFHWNWLNYIPDQLAGALVYVYYWTRRIIW